MSKIVVKFGKVSRYGTFWTFLMALGLFLFLLLLRYERRSIAESTANRRETQLVNQSPDVAQSTSLQDTIYTLDERKRIVEESCRTGNTSSGHALEITGNRAMNVTYCVIPKAGCTVWLRIFKFLAGQKISTGTPMSISKFEVHYRDTKNNKQFDISSDADFRFIRTSLRVMTVRDPFTRLWSAYIDKLLLPDFWATKGKQIIKQTRPSATQRALECGNDVTFPEFVKYVVDNGHDLAHVAQDKHWLPVSDLCDPCIYRPDVIAKQETLIADLTHVLRHTGRGDLLEKIKVENQAEYEIKDEIDYNFAIFDRTKSCASLAEVCDRIWEAFKLNGYIPTTEMFTENVSVASKVTVELLFDVVKRVRVRHNMTREDTKHLRRKALAHAFSSIPTEHIVALQKLYKDDIKLFGYSERPDFIKL